MKKSASCAEHREQRSDGGGEFPFPAPNLAFSGSSPWRILKCRNVQPEPQGGEKLLDEKDKLEDKNRWGMDYALLPPAVFLFLSMGIVFFLLKWSTELSVHVCLCYV